MKIKRSTVITLNSTKVLAIVASLFLLAKALVVSDRVSDMVGDTRAEAKTSASFRSIYELTSSAEAGIRDIQGKIMLGSSVLALLAILPWAKMEPNKTEQVGDGDAEEAV